MTDADGAKVAPLRRKTARGVLVTGSRGVIIGIVHVLTLAVLARILTPADFGLAATVTAIYGLSTLLVQQGLADALVQRRQLTDAAVSTAMSLILAAAAVLLAALWGLAPWLAHTLALPELVLPLRILALVIPVNAVTRLWWSDARRDLEFDRIAVIDVVSSVVGGTIVAIGLALAGLGYWALIGGLVVQETCRMIGFGRGRWRRFRPGFVPDAVGPLVSFGALSSAWTAFGQIYANGERLILPPYLGAEAVAFLSRGRSIVGIFSEFFGIPVNQVLFPVLAKLQNEPERVFRGYREVIALSALLAVPSAIVTYLLAAPLVAIFLGRQWQPVVPVLQVVAANIFFAIIGMPMVATLRGLGRQKLAALLMGAQTLALIAGMLLLRGQSLSVIASVILATSAAAFLGWNWLVSRALGVSYTATLVPMRAGFVYGACLIVTGVVMTAVTGLSTDGFVGAAVFLVLAAAELVLLVLANPRWFLGTDTQWLRRQLIERLRSRIATRS